MQNQTEAHKQLQLAHFNITIWTTQNPSRARFEEEEGGSCRTLAPTLFLQAYNLGIRAEAVPGRAVVDGLEVCWDNVTHGQCGNDSLFCVDSLYSVAPRGPGLQNGFLPWPGLKCWNTNAFVYISKNWRWTAENLMDSVLCNRLETIKRILGHKKVLQCL